MSERQATAGALEPARELTRLLPQLRDGVDAATAQWQAVCAGRSPAALLRAELERLQGAFRFAAAGGYERLAAEMQAGVDALETL